jgi:hypothetical protein
LQGQQFAEKGGFLNKYKLMHIDQEVSLSDLGIHVLAAAFLAAEKAGAIRLEVRLKKALFGLTKATTVYAEPLAKPEFPSSSLEAQVCQLADQFKMLKGENEVWRIVYAWMRQDVVAPWQGAAERIQAGMGERQLLEVIHEKKLKIFTTTRYELPGATRALAASLPAQMVQQLLDDCRTNRPEVWNLMVKQIKQGIDQRKEQDTSSE